MRASCQDSIIALSTIQKKLKNRWECHLLEKLLGKYVGTLLFCCGSQFVEITFQKQSQPYDTPTCGRRRHKQKGLHSVSL